MPAVILERYMAQISWSMRISGMPSLNLSFLVLCRNKYIAASAPREPPQIARKISLSSGILLFCLRAFLLSAA